MEKLPEFLWERNQQWKSAENMGVSYILAGADRLAGKLAAEKLYRLFGIKTMRICGRGTVNWTFLQQGVVDELSA